MKVWTLLKKIGLPLCLSFFVVVKIKTTLNKFDASESFSVPNHQLNSKLNIGRPQNRTTWISIWTKGT